MVIHVILDATCFSQETWCRFKCGHKLVHTEPTEEDQGQCSQCGCDDVINLKVKTSSTCPCCKTCLNCCDSFIDYGNRYRLVECGHIAHVICGRIASPECWSCFWAEEIQRDVRWRNHWWRIVEEEEEVPPLQQDIVWCVFSLMVADE
jgi:hypothetical protein